MSSSLISLSNNLPFFSTTPSSRLPPKQHSVGVHFKSLGFSSSCSTGDFKRRWRRRVWEGEGDPDLEAEVLEFMKTSRNPTVFPSKQELIIGGRMDLVKSIVKHGGWLSFGWDLDDGEEEEEDGNHWLILGNGGVISDAKMGDRWNDSRIFQNRLDGGGCNSLEEAEGGSSSPTSSSCSPSSSGRMENGEDTGIEGILSRLEKERSWFYGLGSEDQETKVHDSWNNGEKEDPTMATPGDHGNESSSSVLRESCKDLFDDSGGMHTHSESLSGYDNSRSPFKPDMWRKWSKRRAGCSERDFEAAEFEEYNSRNDDIITEDTNETGNLMTILSVGDKENDYDQIRSPLQHLGSELTSVLHVISCGNDLVVPDKVSENLSDEANSVSDAWEFRETEIMKARDKLRSLRAQLAVLERKMALKIIKAQRLVEVKQKKIYDARKALSFLRTTCIVWPKSATEVLLVGSFDGWTSQRRMVESTPGVCSLYLKLYPGRYEIKFIVDGMWTVDPLRPIVTNNGHQNNLIIVT